MSERTEDIYVYHVEGTRVGDFVCTKAKGNTMYYKCTKCNRTVAITYNDIVNFHNDITMNKHLYSCVKLKSKLGGNHNEYR
jgi:tRNA(Ile2) C34 agmatinyltransferase TiaS